MIFRSCRILELFAIDEKQDLMIYQIRYSEFRIGRMMVALFNTFFIRSFREEYGSKEEKNRSKE